MHAYNFDYVRRFMSAYDATNPWLLMSSFHEAHEGEGGVEGQGGVSCSPAMPAAARAPLTAMLKE